ncbi:ubiquitin 3 binding protein But2 [Xylariaceae sp. FL0804]|nr:ubiquitin 3 binding protein But2 [Xylariaceae sp. FL0804]
MLPTQAQLETSSFTLSGSSAAVDFARLDAAVSGDSTTFASLPGVAADYGTKTLVPGSAYTLESFACPVGGGTVAVEMSNAAGADTSFRFFEDYNPCPIGLFITTS